VNKYHFVNESATNLETVLVLALTEICLCISNAPFVTMDQHAKKCRMILTRTA